HGTSSTCWSRRWTRSREGMTGSGGSRAGAGVFVTGGSGYVGRALIEAFSRRNVGVRALVRRGSEAKLPRGAEAVVGDVFDAASTARVLLPGSTVVHLVGTPKPAPWKAREFETVDSASLV